MNVIVNHRQETSQKHALEQRISSLVDDIWDGAIEVAFLHNLHSHKPGFTLPLEATLYCVFDYHSMHLCCCYPDSENACINCLVQNLFRNYDLTLRKRYQKQDHQTFPFFYSQEYLSVLPTLVSQLDAKDFYSINFLSPTIERQAFMPSVMCDCRKTPRSLMKQLDGHDLELEDRFVDSNLRSDKLPKLEAFVSQSAGIISGERRLSDTLSLPTAITETISGTYQADYCGGKATTMQHASLIAKCEAIERHHMLTPGVEDLLTFGSYDMLKSQAVNPDDLFYSAVHLSDENVPYDPAMSFYWRTAANLTRNSRQLVPAQEVCSTKHLTNERSMFPCTSSGFALGGSYEEAVLFSILEVVERDSFLVHWYLKNQCQLVDPLSIKDEQFQLLYLKAQYCHPNYNFYFLDITTDSAIPAIWGLAIKRFGQGMKTMTTAAAHIFPEKAMYGALKELVGYFSMTNDFAEREAEYRKVFRNQALANKIDHHSGIYGLEEAVEKYDYLNLDSQKAINVQELQQRSIFTDLAVPFNLKDLILAIVQQLKKNGNEVLIIDMTREQIRKFDICCVKTIVTQMYPLTFGYYDMRFSLSSRLLKLNEHFGKKPISCLTDINFSLHPFP
ncbi:MAG: YcaO-like family protein [Calditrichia bacterium]